MLWISSQRFEHGTLYGPDLSQWPAREYDAFEIFEVEERRIEAAKYNADSQLVVPG